MTILITICVVGQTIPRQGREEARPINTGAAYSVAVFGTSIALLSSLSIRVKSVILGRDLPAMNNLLVKPLSCVNLPSNSGTQRWLYSVRLCGVALSADVQSWDIERQHCLPLAQMLHRILEQTVMSIFGTYLSVSMIWLPVHLNLAGCSLESRTDPFMVHVPGASIYIYVP